MQYNGELHQELVLRLWPRLRSVRVRTCGHLGIGRGHYKLGAWERGDLSICDLVRRYQPHSRRSLRSRLGYSRQPRGK